MARTPAPTRPYVLLASSWNRLAVGATCQVSVTYYEGHSGRRLPRTTFAYARVVSMRPLRVDLAGVVVPLRTKGRPHRDRVVREREEGEGGERVHRADTLRTDSVRRGVSR